MSSTRLLFILQYLALLGVRLVAEDSQEVQRAAYYHLLVAIEADIERSGVWLTEVDRFHALLWHPGFAEIQILSQKHVDFLIS